MWCVLAVLNPLFPLFFFYPLSSSDGLSYISARIIFDKLTQASRDVQNNRKYFISLGSQTKNCRAFAHNVWWKVNVWAQSLSGGLPCLMWSSVKWSTPWHASFPQQGQSWHSVISESTCFLLLLWLCALQVEDKQKITSLNDWTKITLHRQTSTPATPAQHLLDLVVTSSYFPSQSVCKKLPSPTLPLILFC